jgi:modulator of FtsH protease
MALSDRDYMRRQEAGTVARSGPVVESALATNKVLRNTYLLLSMTLLFSAMTAGISMALALPPMTYLISIGVAMVMGIFVLPRTVNSSAGIGVIFLITGLLGLGLGPLLNIYLSLPKGPEIVTTAMGGTATIFLALSMYALSSKRDFSFLGGFLFAGFMVIIVAALANVFFAMPALSLAVSAGVIMIMSGFILFDTSRIINGGETNYILATYGLYLSIFNIFINLLSLLGIMGDD